MDRAQKAALASVGVGLLVLGLKLTAYWLTGSIALLIGEQSAGALEAHDVRTRHAGRMTFVDFHLVVPGSMRVDEAHDICDRVETALKAEMGGEAVVTIHVEPEHKAEHSGIVVL